MAVAMWQKSTARRLVSMGADTKQMVCGPVDPVTIRLSDLLSR